jgi:hypothetical protein
MEMMFATGVRQSSGADTLIGRSRVIEAAFTSGVIS